MRSQTFTLEDFRQLEIKQTDQVKSFSGLPASQGDCFSVIDLEFHGLIIVFANSQDGRNLRATVVCTKSCKLLKVTSIDSYLAQHVRKILKVINEKSGFLHKDGCETKKIIFGDTNAHPDLEYC